MTLAQRIMDRATPEPNTGCLLWTGAATRAGYGKVRVGSLKDGTRRTVQTHVAVCEEVHGPVPAGHDVCHRCDTPACVEPTHLFIGTHRANMQDMSVKDRGRRGRIEYAAVRADRRASREVAATFGISAGHVRSIWCGCRGKVRSHIQ